jgi:DNA-binding NarL/FixJ family response regulator
VIALTARSRKEDHEQCLAAEMDDYLSKPLRAADLLAAVDRASPRRLDPRAVLAACGGDDAILNAICRALRAGLPGQVEAVRGALQDGDAVRLREAAHRLCGAVSAFSTVAGGAAAELEEFAAAGRLDSARPLAERLEEVARVLPAALDGLTVESLRRMAGPTVQ